ncbi:MAG: hypothetical protein BK997_05515 [Candidatus Micrarchaeum sp. ARMAN-1]|uniref:Uncharacterized protein n=1 Tax=Sulfobacillus harzensis TaxID=2729629 RepID=A0A7Y0Q643_9FIRM|nr:hypothetical protein [Sulfobacillus harzensis]NMP24964.1 hypothetical protein [Sulfobacillus harzensis]OJI06601.1 MAG: hypothetical protein BK997_05515 [Candidatus Micrarchaeum sp. ARMAN-1]
MRTITIKVAAILVGVLGLLIAGNTFFHGRPVTVAQASSYCGRGVPIGKCNVTKTPINPHARNVAQPKPFWPSPGTVMAGSNFFSSATAQRLENQHGTLTIFRFHRGHQWVLVGDGMSQTAYPAATTPGGAIVAVENCSNQGTGCLNPTVLHHWRDFSTVALPYPSAWPVKLMTTFGTRLLYLADGSQGIMVLDLHNLHWYHGTRSVINQLMSGTGSPPPLK